MDNYREEKPLTIYDIGLIIFRVRQALFGDGLQNQSAFTNYITSQDCYLDSKIDPHSMILTVKEGTNNLYVFNMIKQAIYNIITSNYSTIYSILVDLGYKDPENVYNEFIIRTNCIYTTLQLTETEYCMMLV